MGLRKRILCPGPIKELTEEEKERLELAWKVLCEKGSVNIMDPLNTDTRSIKEILQEDPNAFFSAHCDYYSCDGVPYDEFVKQIMERDSDES